MRGGGGTEEAPGSIHAKTSGNADDARSPRARSRAAILVARRTAAATAIASSSRACARTNAASVASVARVFARCMRSTRRLRRLASDPGAEAPDADRAEPGDESEQPGEESERPGGESEQPGEESEPGDASAANPRIEPSPGRGTAGGVGILRATGAETSSRNPRAAAAGRCGTRRDALGGRAAPHAARVQRPRRRIPGASRAPPRAAKSRRGRWRHRTTRHERARDVVVVATSSVRWGERQW